MKRVLMASIRVLAILVGAVFVLAALSNVPGIVRAFAEGSTAYGAGMILGNALLLLLAGLLVRYGWKALRATAISN